MVLSATPGLRVGISERVCECVSVFRFPFWLHGARGGTVLGAAAGVAGVALLMPKT